jgi:hypothetical protein
LLAVKAVCVVPVCLLSHNKTTLVITRCFARDVPSLPNENMSRVSYHARLRAAGIRGQNTGGEIATTQPRYPYRKHREQGCQKASITFLSEQRSGVRDGFQRVQLQSICSGDTARQNVRPTSLSKHHHFSAIDAGTPDLLTTESLTNNKHIFLSGEIRSLS